MLSYLFMILISSSLFGQDEVKIGNHIWMTKNLDVDRFRNGDKIPEAKTMNDWLKAYMEKKPAWCYYVDQTTCNHTNESYKMFGKLYNHFAVIDPRGLAPKGWRIPTKQDFDDLVNVIGGDKLNGGVTLKSKDHWLDSRYPGTGESKFDALPGGLRNFGGDFNGILTRGEYWSSTLNPNNASQAYWASFGYATPTYTGSKNGLNVGSGLSIKCIKD